MNETYDADRIFELAVDVDKGHRCAAIILRRGETAWNPTTSKDRPLVGPSLLEYWIHPSGIRVIEEDLTSRCMGGEADGLSWRRCTATRLTDGTRCTEHSLATLAQRTSA